MNLSSGVVSLQAQNVSSIADIRHYSREMRPSLDSDVGADVSGACPKATALD